jgi:hypothetical protein
MAKNSPLKQVKTSKVSTTSKPNPKTTQVTKNNSSKVVTIDPKDFMGNGNKKTTEFNKYKLTNVSKELGDKIDETTQKNKFRNIVERQSQNDSITAYNATKGSAYSKGSAGNKAANETRDAGGSPETKVYKGHNSEGYTTYSRDRAVELNMPEAVMNKKTGQYTYDKKKTLKRKMNNWTTKDYKTPGDLGVHTYTR